MFQAVIVHHQHIAPAQKLYHLRSKVKGEPYQIVKRFYLVDDNFNIAWEALKSRYENKRILVNQQMKLLFGIPSLQQESPKAIRIIQNGINDSLAIFKSYKIETESWDPILVHLCSSKLPDETLRAWEDSLGSHKDLPTWSQLNEFLSKRIEILETVSDIRKPSTRDTQLKSQTFYTKSEADKIMYTCKKCKGNHSLRLCKQFKELSPSDRIKFVFSSKLCTNCLSPGHFKSKCPSTNLCIRCNQKHHTMLHLNERLKRHSSDPVNSQSHPRDHDGPSESGTKTCPRATLNTHLAPPTNTENQIDSIQAHFSQNEGATILPTALVHVEHLGEHFTIRALLDAGSEKSFISKQVQQTLFLPVESHKSRISGLGGTIVGDSKGKCNIILKSRESDFKIQIKAIIVSKLSHFLPSRPIKIKNLEEIKKLHLADPYFYKPSAIDMIIGSDYLPLINLEGVKSNVGSSLEARQSHFGWYLSGPEDRRGIKTFSTIVMAPTDNILQEQLKKFWEIEDAENIKTVSDADQYCESFYQKIVQRQEDGKYVVQLPFKQEFPEEIFLGPSKNIALAQFYRMEKTLDKTPDLKMQYNKVLQEYIFLKQMETIISTDPSTERHFSCFLPHHAVLRPESTSTKLRVVFNASQKTGSSFSLNDALHQGPALQTDLLQIILNWRNYKYVFTGDIEKMYRQIWIHGKHRKYQQILFRSQPYEIVQPYQLKTVTFGMNCAPFLAIRTLHQLSEDCKVDYPKASSMLKDEIYVDDILSGGHTLHEAKEKQCQLSQALLSAGFPMKKITANNKNLLHIWPREDLLNEDFLKIDDSSNLKTLGIRWNATNDFFYYVVEPVNMATNTTKRQILSTIAKLFDPIGWLSPVIIVAKMLMQELWKTKIDWDEVVSPSLLEKWNRFLQNLICVSELKIPRWVHFTPNHQIQIHGFCDSSEKGYCGTIYMRVLLYDDIRSNLLIAKTKVAPLKKVTVPKLELCGALLLSKMIRRLTENYSFQYDLFLWTDSSIVLGWLNKPPQSLKTFVANRVTQIINLTNITQWKHVTSEDNPADLGTRGCTPQELKDSKLWWQGPNWLSHPEELWPKPREFESTNLEEKKHSNFHLLHQETKIKADYKLTSFEALTFVQEFLAKFSCLGRALRVFSYCIRYVNRMAKQPFCSESFITTEEITYSKNRLILIAQQTYFSDEYQRLQNKHPLNRKSRLLSLNPFIDKDNLIRVGGRLNNAGLSYNEQHPIFLPESSYLVVLLINYTHKILLHADHHIMLRAIRQTFYIPRAKN